MYSVYFFIIAIIAAIVHILLAQSPIVETLLLYILLFTCGLQGIFAFLGHFFRSNEIAVKIGWPVGNPFQIELSFANLAFGVLGIMCIWLRGNFWTAVIIGKAIFLWGCAYVHIIDIKRKRNFNIYNAGPLLYMDIINPIVMLILLIIYLHFV